jgi:hypothetical protein
MQQATIHFLLRTKNFRQGDRTAVAGGKKAPTATLSRKGSQESVKETGTSEKQLSENRKGEVVKPAKQKPKKMVS